jgi:hypothetical protein
MDAASILSLLVLAAVLPGGGAARCRYWLLGYSEDGGSALPFRMAVGLTASGLCLSTVALHARSIILIHADHGFG